MVNLVTVLIQYLNVIWWRGGGVGRWFEDPVNGQCLVLCMIKHLSYKLKWLILPHPAWREVGTFTSLITATV